MTLTCDLCEGSLEVDLGGQGARCVDCGLYYPMGRLREKLAAAKKAVVEAPIEPVIVEPVAEVPAAPVWEAPAEPVVETPAAPVWVAPAEPVVETPAVPVWEAPVEPVVEIPAAPVWEAPAEPVVEIPAAPVWVAPAEPVVEIPAAPVWEAPVAAKQDGFSDRSTWKRAADRLTGNLPEFMPQQFVMYHNGAGNGDLCGWIQQGGIGLGDKVYLNSDYQHGYTVACINDDLSVYSAKAGAQIDLFLTGRVPRNQLRLTGTVYGTPSPIVNAYNYPGSTELFFTYLMVNAFPQYEVFADVIHSQLKIPVSYLFCKDGQPVLAVFTINSCDSKGRYQVEKAARLLKAEGIACTHFYENYRNDTPYVIQRVQAAMG